MTTSVNPPNGKRNKVFKELGSVSSAFTRIKNAIRDSFIDLLSMDEPRRGVVLNDIIAGSTPKTTYYILLAISALIAGFGLLTNSPAVVIGAMLVSPLMTPIFGISLGLVQGNVSLLREGLIAEIGGVVLAIAAAAILGFFPFAHDVTAEMLARTSPTLLDLLVATLAGMAGCLAMIDERISPVLPGIAMATSLTPPLAVCGLCLAFGAFDGAWGAFLLFFANFLAILAVSALLFIVAGFVNIEEVGSRFYFLKRLLGPAIGLVFVTVLLTHALVGIIGERRTTKAIKATIEKEMSSEPATFLEKVTYKRKGDNIDILATLTTPRVLSPKKIKEMQNKLNDNLGLKSNLIMRCNITKDISSTGSASGVVDRNLDGEFITTKLHPRVKRLQIAEQVLREILDDYPGFYLDSLDLVQLGDRVILVVSIQGSRKLIPYEVERFENAVRERLGDAQVRLLIRSVDMVDVSSKGRVLYGMAHFGCLSPAETAMQERVEHEVKSAIIRIKDMYAPNVDAVRKNGKWLARAEVVGPRVLRPSEVQSIERGVSGATKQDVTLHAWCRVELMVTRGNYISVEDFTKELVEKRQTSKDQSKTQ
jgi:uncharacterized hydrophobic protein (TIGR00271 family)